MYDTLDIHNVEAAAVVWFKIIYLTDNSINVILTGIVSNWPKLLLGVPQGSISGHSLFLVNIKNIINDIRSNIRCWLTILFCLQLWTTR